MDNDKELKSLISLLDDPDKTVYKAVEKKLLLKGSKIVSDLEKTWEQSKDVIIHQRIKTIIDLIQHEEAINYLKEWNNTGDLNLLKGAWLVARYQYPKLKLEDIETEINTIVEDLKAELNNNLTPLKQIKVMNHILYDVHHFLRNNRELYTPQNSFINEVLETRRGNSITLAIIYLIVGQWSGIKLTGVNLPKNFIIAYQNKKSENRKFNNDNDVLFYINPFNRGAVLGRKEIDYFLKQQQIIPKKSFFVPCDNQTIIQRLVHNLIYSYKQLGYDNKVDEIQKMAQIFGEMDSLHYEQ